MGKSWIRKITTALALVSFLLQAASIASPGWIVYINGNTEEHHSLFYRRTCKGLVDETKLDETKCKYESFHDLYSDQRERLVQAQVSRAKIASVDFEYNSLVCKQVLMVVVTSLSLIMVVSQIIQNCRPDRHNIRLILLSAIVSATSAGLVIAVVFNDIVHIYYQIELYSLDSDRDHTYLGFPFCLAMLLGSVMFIFFAEMSIASQLYTPNKKIVRRPITTYEDDVSVREKTPEVTNKPSNESKGKDNPVFSEKL